MIITIIISTLLTLSVLIALMAEYVMGKEGEIYVSAVRGCLFGALHNEENQELINDREETVGVSNRAYNSNSFVFCNLYIHLG